MRPAIVSEVLERAVVNRKTLRDPKRVQVTVVGDEIRAAVATAADMIRRSAQLSSERKNLELTAMAL